MVQTQLMEAHSVHSLQSTKSLIIQGITTAICTNCASFLENWSLSCHQGLAEGHLLSHPLLELHPEVVSSCTVSVTILAS